MILKKKVIIPTGTNVCAENRQMTVSPEGTLPGCAARLLLLAKSKLAYLASGAILGAALFLLPVNSCYAAMPETDKIEHFAAGYIITDQLKQHTHLTWLERQGVVLLIAYAKERTDKYVDKNDIFATMLGGIFYSVKF